MSETAHESGSYADRIVFASMINDITKWKSRKVLNREKWLLTQQNSDLVIGVSVVQDRKRFGHIMKNDQFADGEWDKLAVRAISELIITEHQVFKCSNILQTGVLMRRKKGGGVGTKFKYKPENHLVNTIPPIQKNGYGNGYMKTMATVFGYENKCAMNYSITRKTGTTRTTSRTTCITSTPMTTMTQCTYTSTDAWRTTTCTEPARIFVPQLVLSTRTSYGSSSERISPPSMVIHMAHSP